MASRRQVPHELTLLAIGRDPEHPTCQVVLDAVETSRHYASHFTRRWVRDPEVYAIVAGRPDDPLDATQTHVVRR